MNKTSVRMKGWCECIKLGIEEEERKKRKEKWQDMERGEGRKEKGTAKGGEFYT